MESKQRALVAVSVVSVKSEPSDIDDLEVSTEEIDLVRLQEIAKSTTKPKTGTKRGKYMKIDELMKVKIGEYAYEYGDTNAIEKFSHILGETLSARTVYELKRLYSKHLEKGTPPDAIIALNPNFKRRPLSMEDLKKKIKDNLAYMKKSGYEMTHQSVIHKAKCFVSEYDPFLLKENGGHIDINRGWVKSIRAEMRISKPTIVEDWLSDDEETDVKTEPKSTANEQYEDMEIKESPSDAEIEMPPDRKRRKYRYIASPPNPEAPVRGRPVKLGPLDGKLLKQLYALKKTGTELKVATIIAVATELVEQENPQLLKENGGSLYLGKKWGFSIQKRMERYRDPDEDIITIENVYVSSYGEENDILNLSDLNGIDEEYVPDSTGEEEPLSPVIPLQSSPDICENDEPHAILQAWNSGPMHQRTKYLKISKETKFEIGRYAVKHGPTETAKVYSSRLGLFVTPNKVYYYRKLYQQSLKTSVSNIANQSEDRENSPARKEQRSRRKSRKRSSNHSVPAEESQHREMGGHIKEELISNSEMSQPSRGTAGDAESPPSMPVRTVGQILLHRPSLFESLMLKPEPTE